MQFDISLIGAAFLVIFVGALPHLEERRDLGDSAVDFFKSEEPLDLSLGDTVSSLGTHWWRRRGTFR
jgi:hypothetical protein